MLRNVGEEKEKRCPKSSPRPGRGGERSRPGLGARGALAPPPCSAAGPGAARRGGVDWGGGGPGALRGHLPPARAAPGRGLPRFCPGRGGRVVHSRGRAGRQAPGKGSKPPALPPARCSAPAGRAGPGPRPRPGGAGRCGRAAAGLPAERAQPQPRHEGGEAGPPAPGTPRVARGRGRVPPRRAEAPRGGGSGASLRGPRSTRKGVVQSCRRVTGRCVWGGESQVRSSSVLREMPRPLPGAAGQVLWRAPPRTQPVPEGQRYPLCVRWWGASAGGLGPSK